MIKPISEKDSLRKCLRMTYRSLGMPDCAIYPIIQSSIYTNWINQKRWDIAEEYESWRKRLTQIKNIEIPRNYFSFVPTKIIRHVFGDASLENLFAVAYFCASELDKTKMYFLLLQKREFSQKKTTKHTAFGAASSRDSHNNERQNAGNTSKHFEQSLHVIRF